MAKNPPKVAAKAPATDPRTTESASAPADATATAQPPEDDDVRPRRKSKPEEELVSVTVPRKFKLTKDDGMVVDIEAGIQDLPRGLAEHWYAKANGVELNED